MIRSFKLFVLAAIITLAVCTGIALPQGKKGQVQDPVCELWVDKNKDLSYTFKGETYYFCSVRDMTLFKENPAKYLKK